MTPIFLNRFLLLCLSMVILASVVGCSQTDQPKVHDCQGNALGRLGQPGDEGPWVVVVYLAVWCHPCREEVPELNALAKDGVLVWGVDCDRPATAAEVRRKMQAMGIAFPVLDPADVPLLGLEEPPVVPATYIINPHGTMERRLLGPQSRRGLLRVLKTLRLAWSSSG